MGETQLHKGKSCLPRGPVTTTDSNEKKRLESQGRPAQGACSAAPHAERTPRRPACFQDARSKEPSQSHPAPRGQNLKSFLHGNSNNIH